MQMLEFVRPIRLQVERTDIREVFHQAVTLAESNVQRGDIEVAIDMSPDLPLVDADEHQLVQVFTNLLTNAFEALGGKGEVELTATIVMADQESAFTLEPGAPIMVLVIDVIDRGAGVPPHLIDRIFDPFFTTKPQGSGLGLSIVRKIIDAHDGRIELTVTPNLGTRFRVTLPVSSNAGGFKQKGN
jgi:signal transduction histidine kinase